MFQRSNHEKNQEKQLVGILLHLPRQKDACRGFLVPKNYPARRISIQKKS